MAFARHRTIDLNALAKQVQVRAVRDNKVLPPEIQEKMTQTRELLNHYLIFKLRAVRGSAELRKQFERSSPVRINLDELKANDEALRAHRIKALREQGSEFPGKESKEGAK